MSTIGLFPQAVRELDRRVEQVSDDAWGRPTPCAEWDVRALLGHVAGECAWVPPLLAGRTIADVGDSLSGDLLGQDPKASWRRIADEAVAAAETVDPDAPVQVSSGTTTAEAYLAEVAADLTLHAWDLARATGQDDRIPDALVEHATATVEPQVDAWRAAGVLGEPVEVPPDASPQTRLLGMVGRASA